MTAVERWVDLGFPVRYLDFGGPPDGPIVVAVHGLGGSALNWLAIAPLLASQCRLLAPDLAGHGLTRAHGQSTSVRANRLLLDCFVHTVTGSPVILMGNSMGGMISLLQAGTRPHTASGLILLDPAVPFGPVLPGPLVSGVFALYAMPVLGRALMARRRRMPAERAVSFVLRLCCVDPARVPAEVVGEHVELARQRASFDDVERDFIHSARSVVATAGGSRSAAYREAIAAITAPVLLIHGERDRLVPVSASRALARSLPAWDLVTLPDTGHVPQLEAPAQTADAILRWFASAGRMAVIAATHARP
jgi:pimeloyl-ACP methyl ester carboxylesterase